MNFWDVCLSIFLLAALALAVWTLRRQGKKNGCGSCSSCCRPCRTKAEAPQTRR